MGCRSRCASSAWISVREPRHPSRRLPFSGPPGWSGHVELIGFPFRFGTGGPISAHLFDFDHEGRWLLTASRDGMLHAWKLDGSGRLELFPRERFS